MSHDTTQKLPRHPFRRRRYRTRRPWPSRSLRVHFAAMLAAGLLFSLSFGGPTTVVSGARTTATSRVAPDVARHQASARPTVGLLAPKQVEGDGPLGNVAALGEAVGAPHTGPTHAVMPSMSPETSRSVGGVVGASSSSSPLGTQPTHSAGSESHEFAPHLSPRPEPTTATATASTSTSSVSFRRRTRSARAVGRASSWANVRLGDWGAPKVGGRSSGNSGSSEAKASSDASSWNNESGGEEASRHGSPGRESKRKRSQSMRSAGGASDSDFSSDDAVRTPRRRRIGPPSRVDILDYIEHRRDRREVRDKAVTDFVQQNQHHPDVVRAGKMPESKRAKSEQFRSSALNWIRNKPPEKRTTWEAEYLAGHALAEHGAHEGRGDLAFWHQVQPNMPRYLQQGLGAKGELKPGHKVFGFQAVNDAKMSAMRDKPQGELTRKECHILFCRKLGSVQRPLLAFEGRERVPAAVLREGAKARATAAREIKARRASQRLGMDVEEAKNYMRALIPPIQHSEAVNSRLPGKDNLGKAPFHDWGRALPPESVPSARWPRNRASSAARLHVASRIQNEIPYDRRTVEQAHFLATTRVWDAAAIIRGTFAGSGAAGARRATAPEPGSKDDLVPRWRKEGRRLYADRRTHQGQLGRITDEEINQHAPRPDGKKWVEARGSLKPSEVQRYEWERVLAERAYVGSLLHKPQGELSERECLQLYCHERRHRGLHIFHRPGKTPRALPLSQGAKLGAPQGGAEPSSSRSSAPAPSSSHGAPTGPAGPKGLGSE